jgi:hypothetical protein
MPRTATLTGLVALTLLALWTAPSGASHSELSGHWRLDERSGQVARDASGHGLHGQLGNTPASDGADPAWTTGRIGLGALDFGAGGRSVVVPDSPLLEPGQLTAEAWVRRSGSPGPFSYVLAKGAHSCLAASYALYSGFDGGLAFYVFNGSAFRLASAPASASVWDGSWHHVAGTYDGFFLRLYVDGVEVGTETLAPPIAYGLPSSEAFYIGNYRGSCDKPFTGSVDDVRVSSRALAASELQAHASEPPPAPPAGPPAGGDGAPPKSGAGRLVSRVSCARRVSFRTIARRGLRVSVTVARAGRVRAFMLHRGRRIGGSKAVVVRRRGQVVARVKLQRARVRRALRRHGRIRLSCRAAGPGERSVTAGRRLLLRP